MWLQLEVVCLIRFFSVGYQSICDPDSINIQIDVCVCVIRD